MLYLYDSGAGAKKIQNFESTLFKNEKLALAQDRGWRVPTRDEVRAIESKWRGHTTRPA